MKFSSALQFNAVPDWAPYYLDYSGLKKRLYVIERDVIANNPAPPPQSQQHNASRMPGSDESSNLLGPQTQAYATFAPLLNSELAKIERFYQRKEAELFAEADEIERDVAILDIHPTLERRSSLNLFRKLSTINVSNATQPLRSASPQAGPSRPQQPVERDNDENVSDHLLTNHHRASSLDLESMSPENDIRRKARNLFILLHDLRSYAQLNYTGFNKITKKYDKVTGSELREEYMAETVRNAYPFTAEAQNRLHEHLEAMAYSFGLVSGLGSIDEALHELKKCLREEVVWERNTVWRDMIANERMVNAVGVQSPDLERAGGDTIPTLKPRRITNTQKQILRLLACTALFFVVWAVPVFDGVEQQRCWAMLIYVSLLWATESLPLHVTALLVPFLTVMLGVMRSPEKAHAQLSAGDASKAVFSAMFSSVIMLLLGGFTLAAALSKHDVARIIASWILSKAGTSPKTVLLANMLVATFASMWISNVAAPVLCFSLIRPILRTLPNGSTFAPCLIMGIALASNVGGMASPISSPQNIIAINTMHPPPSWFQWFAVSIPVCILCDLGIWALLLAVYRPHKTTPSIHQTRFTSERLNRRQVYVCAVTLLTILLWCFESKLAFLVGDMGIVAIVPLVLLFGFPKILGKEDFNNFLWTVVILAMGGIALGRAVDSSGLLHELAARIELFVDGFPLFAVMCVFCGLILVCCTFISHTVGSLIILPIVAEVGARLPEPHSRLLVMGSALMASGAMGLPVSGFPNMNAIMLEDTLGNPYLSTMDFFKAGIPSSVVAYFVIISVGYIIMSMLGF
ncbi:SPX domain-containing protein [Kickxella alabastrina]|uniref:SPX domain-containing protein n=1 Tax=Kickxella alabastrina TaxID=61397 RepID=UPI0022202E9E|nr:SPX domain-containing protein [Kickxella alabastrina]KAI7834061.1 SPX domain-containing protein [Kickxella alabastrina]